MTNPVPETRNLRKAFGGNVVLEDVSLGFEPRRLSAIIGPNGTVIAQGPPEAIGDHAEVREAHLGKLRQTRFA